MTSTRAVVDASVVVNLLVDRGSRGHSAADRLASASLHAPDHLPVEVVNALRVLRNRGDVGQTEAALAIDGLWSLSIQLWPFDSLAPRAWELGGNVTSYDAAYVALAELLDAPLLTSDRRLARASGPTCLFEVFD